MIPILGIPYLNRPDLLHRCLESIDYPVDTLVLVDNSGFRAVDGVAACHRDKCRRLCLISNGVNAGVACSWNTLIKALPAPWWFLVNNDIEFSPGDLARVDKFMQEKLSSPACDLACAYANHGASAFAVTETGIHGAGLFDENLYPAYLEDCDWSRRVDLAGLTRENIPGCEMFHGETADPSDQTGGSCTVNATKQLAQNNARTHNGNFEYYKAKWGGLNGQEKYAHPFNDPGWPVWAWRYEPARRARQQWT